MAKVWKVYGTEQRGGPVAEWPWAKCVSELKLDELTRTEERPKFGEKTSVWPTTIVAQLEADEAAALGLKPGFFASPVDPETVLRGIND